MTTVAAQVASALVEASEELHASHLEPPAVGHLHAMSPSLSPSPLPIVASQKPGQATSPASLHVVDEEPVAAMSPDPTPTSSSHPGTSQPQDVASPTLSMREATAPRPSTPRLQTALALDAMPATSAQPPHTRSPYARSHLRTQSTSALPRAPPMTRAHSLPTAMHPVGNLSLSPVPLSLASPASPLRSPKRTRSLRELDTRTMPASPQERYGSALRPASIGSFEGAPGICDISEDAELQLTPRAASGVSSLYSSAGSLSRRRRPASPLYQVAASFGGGPSFNTAATSNPTSNTSSPLLAPSKFVEHYPSSLASSSVPSTPTSMRSRSPSISSLETIEDSPDAEEEAIEADRIARLKAAADREAGEEERRSSLDVQESRGRSLGFGKRDSRKRWSVCGAERRQDLDLETIWED